MIERPSLAEQISALNNASEIIAANYRTIVTNGWPDDEVAAVQIGLGSARATLEWLLRNEAKLREAFAKPVSGEFWT